MDDEENLSSSIIPTKHPNVPVAPNLFLEAKGLDGSADVVRRQACYDGAYGARGMHKLQNYSEADAMERPIFNFPMSHIDREVAVRALGRVVPAACSFFRAR